MSWKATSYVKEIKSGERGEAITRSEKLVLLILADCYNEDRGYAWPSTRRLAADALMSKRQVQRCLRNLESKGLLKISLGGHGQRDASRYGFPGLVQGKPAAITPLMGQNKGDAMSPLKSARVTSRAPKGDISARKDDMAVSPEPQVRTTIEPSEGGAHKSERHARSILKGNGSGLAHSERGGLVDLSKGNKLPAEIAPLFKAVREHAEQAWTRRFGSKPTWGAKDYAQLSRLLRLHKDMPLEEFKGRWERYIHDNEPFIERQGHSLAYFCSRFDAYIDRPDIDLPTLDIAEEHRLEDEYCRRLREEEDRLREARAKGG